MTRAPQDTEKPVRRLVQANGDSVVVEFNERRVVFRYPRAKKALLETTWGVLLVRALGGR